MNKSATWILLLISLSIGTYLIMTGKDISTYILYYFIFLIILIFYNKASSHTTSRQVTDSMRLLGIVLVVIGHSTYYSMGGADYTDFLQD